MIIRKGRGTVDRGLFVVDEVRGGFRSDVGHDLRSHQSLLAK